MNMHIRTDGSRNIGTGHIMRCIALAQAWQNHGGDVTFLSHCDSKALVQRIIDEGFEFIPIERPHPDSHDLSQTLTALKQLETRNSKLETWLVLDGYHLTPDYQKAIKENGYRLLIIDDMAHLDIYHADILLNQNIHAPNLNYSCDKDTVKLLGCKYVMLRKEFLKYKDWKWEIPDKARNILITMGGSDPDNVTLKIIRAMNRLKIEDIKIRVIVGPSNPYMASLKKIIGFSHLNFKLLSSVEKMSHLMVWADAAFCAGGSTCWELAFMGIPFSTVILAENQKNIAEGLDKAGASANLGWFKDLSEKELAEALSWLVGDENGRQRMSNIARGLVDGKGAERVIDGIVRF